MPSRQPTDLNSLFPFGVSMLAWGYNEEQLVEGFLTRATEFIKSVAADYEVVFVDDGSTDRTGALADAFAARNPRVRVVHHDRNLNVGYACRTAVAHATKEYLFWQTVDWSYDLTNLRIFLALTQYYDVVQGVRPVPIRLLSYIPIIRSIYRVKSRSDNLRKAIVSLGNYYMLRILFGVPFHDFQNVTIYRTKMVQSFPMRAGTSFVNPEFLIRSHAAGCSFLEVPIHFIKRSAGEGKGTRFRVILRSIADIAANWASWGLKLRLAKAVRERGDIFRVSEPFGLPESVLHLCVPLFKDYGQDPAEPRDPAVPASESPRARAASQ